MSPQPKPEPKAEVNHLPDRIRQSYRLTKNARWIIGTLAKKRGVSAAAVIEWSLRDLCVKEGVQLP